MADENERAVFISQREGKSFSNRLSCSERSSLWRWLHRVPFKSADLRLEMISPAAWQLERHVVMAYSVRHAMRDPLAVIQAHVTEFTALGARRIGVFGSFVRGEARGDSDVDVYVEFDDQRRTYDNFFALHELLERLMGRRVDLVTDKALDDGKARLILPTVRYATYRG